MLRGSRSQAFQDEIEAEIQGSLVECLDQRTTVMSLRTGWPRHVTGNAMSTAALMSAGIEVVAQIPCKAGVTTRSCERLLAGLALHSLLSAVEHHNRRSLASAGYRKDRNLLMRLCRLRIATSPVRVSPTHVS